jgi:hypothetical protein
MRRRDGQEREAEATLATAEPSPPEAVAPVLRLQRSAGNQAVARWLRDSGSGTATDGGSGPAPDAGSSAPTEERLDAIEQNYRDMIESARSLGADEAANNLEWFLAGSGDPRVFTHTWLRDFGPVTDAERVNQERFERQLTEAAEGMSDGDTRVVDDYWDRALTASTLTQLYYASGTSQLHSAGRFELSQSGDVVTITGTVHHRWFDPYDWNAGSAALVPGFGVVSDDDGLLMQRHRGAKPFMLEGTWDQTVTATITKREYWFDSYDYRWAGP